MPRWRLRHGPDRLSLVLLAAVVVAAPAGAQWIPTRAFGVRDGLAQSQVMAITHDGFGYLWLATQGGLSRFDGVRFTTFTTAEGLPDNVVTSLAAGPAGELWLGTDSGRLARWDGRSFASWLGPGDADDAVVGLVVDRDGLLVATGSGLWRWLPDQIELLYRGPVRQLAAADGAGPGCRAWLLAASLYCVTGEGVAGTPAAATLDGVSAVAPEAGMVWLGSADGSVIRSTPAGLIDRRIRLRRAVRVVLPAGDGGAWVGAEDGLWRLHADGVTERQPLVASDPAMEIRCLALDREGNLWASPWSGGLFQLAPDGFAVFGRSSGFATSEVWGLLEDESGCMWMATEDVGVLRWCDGGIAGHLWPGRELPAARAMALDRDGDGVLWVATAVGVVEVAGDGRSRVWTAAGGLPDPYVRALLRDHAGRLWAATRGGLARFDGESWRAWTAADGLPDDNLRALAVDRSDVLWIATHGAGVVRFDGTELVVFGVAEGLPHPRVWSLTVDSEDRVWAGTDGGVWVHPTAGGPDWTIDAEAGLPSPSVLSLVEDAAGAMWAGTTRGLCRLGATGKVELALTADDGMAGSEAAESAAVLDRLGRLWVGTADGVTRLDPARLPGNDVPPRLALERLEVDGAPWPGPVPFAASGLPVAAELRLGPSISDLRFDFAAISFTAPERVRYRFMLAGWDDDLGAPTDERHVTYRRLSPGRYRFVATACNNDGVWTSPPLELPLLVLPAWYQTWWFRAAVLLAVCAFVVGGFAVHTAGQRRRRAVLEREVEVRTAELAEANRQIVGQNEQLEELSRTDPLTGLGNRRVLADQLPLEMALIRREIVRRAPDPERYHGAAILMIDLDHFKAVNDRWGHEVGDRVLRTVADGLVAALREVDLAVRWGGEEFVILARAIDRSGLELLARRVLEIVAAGRVELSPDETVAVTASIGFVPYPLGFSAPLAGEQWSALLDLADRLLYLAKQRGRDRACGLAWKATAEVVSDGELARQAHADPTASLPGLEAVEIRRRS